MNNKLGPAGRLAKRFLETKLTPLAIVGSIILGLGTVAVLPREEEPQIKVPMVDIFVQMPGASAQEVEERVVNPMEKLLWEITGVEYLYSTASAGMAMSIVRFEVGSDEEMSLVKVAEKLRSNFDQIPPGVSFPLIKLRTIDDVPILAITFHSKNVDHHDLRAIAAEVEHRLKEIPDVAQTYLIGGLRKQLHINLDLNAMEAFRIGPALIHQKILEANSRLQVGEVTLESRRIKVDAGGFLSSAQEVADLVIATTPQGNLVYLSDLAEVVIAPEEPNQFVFFSTGGELGTSGNLQPAVTLSISKRKGTNATLLAEEILDKLENLKERLIPEQVQVTVTRNYGETAAEKSNELLFHMAIAVVSVSLLIFFMLGLKASGIVLVAIPVTLALTLATFYFFGYTLNRITLFALIFSIGILVDDAIVVVENIERHFALLTNRRRSLSETIILAVDEVGNPTILATIAVVAAILPMAFVRGLMGPYMRPIPVGASAAMFFSLLVAFIVTPYLARLLLRSGGHAAHKETKESYTTVLYRKFMKLLIQRPAMRFGFLATNVLLLVGAMVMVPAKLVRVKMLPFDNKSEFQVIIDLPEGATLEQTAAVTTELAATIATVPEVINFQVYIGTASPFNFNGLVRHYYLRSGANLADIQVNLVPKHERDLQSHDIAKRVRDSLAPIAARHGAAIKVAEVPPGPPVLQTLVAEVYGPDYRRAIELAEEIRDIFAATEGVVDVDWYVEAEQQKVDFSIDRRKASLQGISAGQIASVMMLADRGMEAGILHLSDQKEDVNMILRLPQNERESLAMLKRIPLNNRQGSSISVGEVATVSEAKADRSIYHKNLMPVVYITADVAGAAESPVYAIFQLQEKIDLIDLPEGYGIEQFSTHQPRDDNRFAMKWDGEWHITYEVFRDLGIAFAVVLLLIYVLVVGWFESFMTPLVIMAAIPFSLVGILPAHWALGAFFTATSMIGFIAGAGIVVRNSIILVDFIELRLKEGMSLDEAVVDAGAVRFRPMLLTAAAVIVGAGVILFDPIFQGLAISLMAGEVASLLMSRMTVPVLYHLAARKRPIVT